MERLQETLAAEIRRLRINLHMDQMTLAEKVEITRSSISNIESSRQAVSLDMFVKIALALNQDPAKMLSNVRDQAMVMVSRDDMKDKHVDESILTTIQTTMSKPSDDKDNNRGQL